MIRTLLAAVALALLLPSCGSTSGEGDAWLVVQPFLFAEGMVISDVPTGGVTTEVVAPPPVQVGAGLGPNIRILRAVFSYDISDLPTDAIIDSATLNIYQYDVVGSPFGQLGDIVVDHVDIGAALDPADFDGGTLDASFATLSSSTEVGWRSVVVKGLVEDDLANGRTESSFRVYFAGDVAASIEQQLVSLGDSQGGPAYPLLRIEYKIQD